MEKWEMSSKVNDKDGINTISNSQELKKNRHFIEKL